MPDTNSTTPSTTPSVTPTNTTPNWTIALVVLDDGETYSRLEGCSIVITTRDDLIRMDQTSGNIRDLRPLYEIGMSSVTPSFLRSHTED